MSLGPELSTAFAFLSDFVHGVITINSVQVTKGMRDNCESRP